MKFCSNCGAQLDDGAKFCTECGQRIEQAAPAAQIPAEEAPISPVNAVPAALEEAVHVYGQPVNHSFSEPVISETEQGVVHTYGAPASHSFAPPVQAESALSGTYGGWAPAAPEPAAVPQPAAAPVSAPEPAAEATPYTAPAAAEEKPAKAIKMPAMPKLGKKKQKGGKKKSRLGLIIGIVVVVALLFSIFGGGDSDDPNLGLYNGVSCSYAGLELGAEGEWIELKSDGKLKMMLMGDEYSAKWELDGEDITVTQAGDTYYGTLRNGTLVLDLGGMIYTYEKEATETPAAPKETKVPEETAAPAASEAGYWTLKYSEGDESIAMDEQTVAMLADMGIVMYVDLAEDGTGIFMMEEAMPITWSDGKFIADDGSEVAYMLENDELIVEIAGALMHFVPGEKDADAVDAPSGDLLVNELTYYMAISGSMNGTDMNDSAIAQMGGMDIALNGDGTGTLNMFGQYQEITYDNNAIYRAGIPMEYQLDGYYLYLKMSDSIEFTMMVENKAKNRPKDQLTPNDLRYWNGDYYGWWVIDNVISGDAEVGAWWDCCMTLDVFSNGAGFITIWDEDYGR